MRDARTVKLLWGNVDMSNIEIQVTRDSVCMGDDVEAPHYYSFSADANTSLNTIFSHLSSKNYLASVAGRNHSWSAVVNGDVVATFLGNNQIPVPSDSLNLTISALSNQNRLTIRFQYKSAAI